MRQEQEEEMARQVVAGGGMGGGDVEGIEGDIMDMLDGTGVDDFAMDFDLG